MPEARSQSSAAGNVKWQTAALAAISEKSENIWQRAEEGNGLAPPVTPLRVKGIREKGAPRGSAKSAAKLKGEPPKGKRQFEMAAKKQGAMSKPVSRQPSARSQQTPQKNASGEDAGCCCTAVEEDVASCSGEVVQRPSSRKEAARGDHG